MVASAERESEHQRLKLDWDRTWGPTNRPFRRDKTSVLQLSWTQPHDDLNVGPELARLGQIFRDAYGFKVRHALLDIHKAQQQALSELSRFVYEEDDERPPLIIYYAGNGHRDNAEPVDMCLEGKTDPKSPLEERTGIIWSKAEPAIRETLADVLLIFDCCDAGRLAIPYTRGGPQSYFQILGACSEDQTTRGPGNESFTTALIWALEELAEKALPFSTAELRGKIKEEPFENITISVKGSKHEDSELVPSTAEREEQMERCEYIDLRFHFGDKVGDEHMKHTAGGLKKLLDHGHPHWKRVSFLGKSSIQERESSSVHRVATKLIKVARESRRRKSSAAVLSASGSYPAAVITELPPSASPTTATAAADGACMLPSQPVRPKTSPRHSRDNQDANSQFSGDTKTTHKPKSRNDEDDDSVTSHLQAILRKFQSSLSRFFGMIARWLMPRSEYERIPDEPA